MVRAGSGSRLGCCWNDWQRMTQWEQLSLDDLGISREQITPTIARTGAESLRAIAAGQFYGSTARWSADQLRALADEIEALGTDPNPS